MATFIDTFIAQCPTCGKKMERVEYYTATISDKTKTITYTWNQKISTIKTTYKNITYHIGSLCLDCGLAEIKKQGLGILISAVIFFIVAIICFVVGGPLLDITFILQFAFIFFPIALYLGYKYIKKILDFKRLYKYVGQQPNSYIYLGKAAPLLKNNPNIPYIKNGYNIKWIDGEAVLINDEFSIKFCEFASKEHPLINKEQVYLDTHTYRRLK
ncbi:hypothetical protein FACS189426_16160 [Bacteroidia bacterium]|nr:hypothetical protein FACS189426_16160 [Bacteroidia bacterium]